MARPIPPNSSSGRTSAQRPYRHPPMNRQREVRPPAPGVGPHENQEMDQSTGLWPTISFCLILVFQLVFIIGLIMAIEAGWTQ